MSKQISSHAHVAKIIRAELKKHGVKGRVRSSCFAGGNSVTVKLECAAPWVKKAVDNFCLKFEYGHFDGMFDIYEYSNVRDDIPQVKYLSVDNNFDDDWRQKAYEFLHANMMGYEDHPESYSDAANLQGAGDWVSTEVWQVLNGSWDERSCDRSEKFWKKPRVRCAA